MKLATAEAEDVTAMVQALVALLLQAPLHPAKVEPVPGTAVSVTLVPLATLSVQELPQTIPEGSLVTVPDPDPVFETLSVAWIANSAVTVVLSASVNTQEDVPVQEPPDQPTNREPLEADAESVT